MNAAAMFLRLRLWVLARGPLLCLAMALALIGAVALAWLLPLRSAQSERRIAALTAAATPAPAAAPAPTTLAADAPTSSSANLAQFHEVLGERRYVEQQVGTLFALAAKNGIVLSQGEYKSAVVRDGGFSTYQVNLPVKGSYGAIWQFAMAALRAIPFASLDDISFKRDSIGQSGVEARVRFTLYLQGTP
ncbi:MAG: hypothetical protein JWP59_2663 [Massilia sp.]|nr:hypothetical protein [Massilia sp.]